MNDNSSATVMLGLEGMTVLAVSERDGELEYAIETTATTGWCPVCGAVARLHDRRPTWVRDLPAGDRPVTLVWVKRVWRCVHERCEQQTWTETHPAIASRSSWTARARAQACRRVGRDGHAVAAVAREFGVGWATVMAAVREHGAQLLARARPGASATAIGVDETAFMRASAMRPTVFATGIVDLHRGRLIDVVPGRSRKVLADWLADQSGQWAAGIEVAALDPFRGYSAALSAGLPAAVRVLDPFHVVRLGFAAVDDVRRRVQPTPTGIAAAEATRSMASAGCCAAARRISLNTLGGICWPESSPATMAAKSPRPGWPPRNCARSIAAATAVKPPPACMTGPSPASTRG